MMNPHGTIRLKIYEPPPPKKKKEEEEKSV